MSFNNAQLCFKGSENRGLVVCTYRNLKALKLGQTSRGKVGGINEMFYQRLAEFDSLLDLDLSCSSELNDTGGIADYFVSQLHRKVPNW